MRNLLTILIITLFTASCSMLNFNKKESGQKVKNAVVLKKKTPQTVKTKTFTKSSYNNYIKFKSKRKVSSVDARYANPAEKENNYKRAVSLINSNSEKNRVVGINILQSLANNFPGYTAANELLDRLESPFSLASSKVEKYIEEWVSRPSEVPNFNIKIPARPRFPAAPILTKSEFETTEQFNNRITASKKRHKQEIDVIKNGYLAAVAKYNEAVRDYNTQLTWEHKSRQEKVPSMRKRYLKIAFNEILGRPVLTSLDYNADNEIFFGKVMANQGNLELNVKIPVVLAKAKIFEQNIKTVKPIINIDVIDGDVVFSKVEFKHGNDIYPAELVANESAQLSLPSVTAGINTINLNDVTIEKVKELTVEDIIESNRKFFAPK